MLAWHSALYAAVWGAITRATVGYHRVCAFVQVWCRVLRSVLRSCWCGIVWLFGNISGKNASMGRLKTKLLRRPPFQ